MLFLEGAHHRHRADSQYAGGIADATPIERHVHDLPFDGMVSADLSRDAQEILEAGMTAMTSGKEVELPL